MRAFKAKFGGDIKKYTIHRVKRDVKDQAQRMRDSVKSLNKRIKIGLESLTQSKTSKSYA
jgi:hypothetical protein